MRVRSALLISLVVLLLLSAGPGTVTALDDHGSTDDRRQDIHIKLQGDGDASWVIEHHYVLHNETERERFAVFAEEVRSGQRDVGTDRTTFARFVPYAEERTDREMSIVDAGWERPEIRPASEVEGFNESIDDNENVSIGTLRFTFTWRNFAGTDDGYLHLQDTFLTASGDPWLGGLTPSQRLFIEVSEEYDFETAPQGIDNNRLAWSGPTDLESDDFDIVLVSQSGPLEGLLGAWPSLLGGLLVLAIVGGAAWYLRTRRGTIDGVSVPDEVPASDSLPRRLQAYVTGRATDEDAGDPGSADPAHGGPGPGAVDPELLSDEERVTRLLNENGGRMKQAAIVDETGWSNAKVSQLLSQMDDDDEIEKLRIGRENLITLPDVDPTQVE